MQISSSEMAPDPQAQNALVCARCGKKFKRFSKGNLLVGLPIALLIILLPFSVFSMLEGTDFGIISTPYFLASIIVVAAIPAAIGFRMMNQEKKKYLVREADGEKGKMYCLECQEKLRSETEAYGRDLKAVDADPVMRPVMQEWRLAHGDEEPAQAQWEELRKAVGLDMAGQFEEAAKIFEKHKIWKMAGRLVRRTACRQSSTSPWT
ncbi:hypothetical protein [Methanomassiliicoccus luminyensis]|uniref:hypothetical protein n=2 Tax=Methanomassiliicoccus luminyensis TaxID=1080712 RepID=UPI001F487FBA|nr:hypothetical protein [Methanomassiliicoccus luminyensis]